MKLRHLIVLAGVALSASPAAAHPKLLSAAPAAAATATPTGRVRLVFDERLMPQRSTAVLVMTGMPGMANHPDMKMPGVATALSRDRRTVVLSSARPLPAGTYRVDWAVAGADGHRVSGRHAFSIR
ncbi:hypothetical protein ASG29_04020 [Sphingomonas sp. Leaf412]|uniref:copper resistance protein CopC n=1 Tax=Sphingomonas sp. Leaf412 TaxID=1736370 RepID=UPI0006F52EBF|nr:copper resistance protein CopC [Sphingomonas sp. Leaf412]KQT35278.1 hypothetical protein ASG29_04020 [Sphingomonas sp. Leaf412]